MYVCYAFLCFATLVVAKLGNTKTAGRHIVLRNGKSENLSANYHDNMSKSRLVAQTRKLIFCYFNIR